MLDVVITSAVAWALAAHPVAVEHVQVLVGNGNILNDVTVVWDGATLSQVGHAPPPAGAERIDGTNKILTPGLVETRSHLGVDEVDEEDVTHDIALNDGVATPAFRVADGFNPASVRIPIVRDEGITSALIIPDGRIIHGLGAWADLTGSLTSPPLSPVAMFGSVGRNAATAVGARGGVWLTLREIFADVRFYQRSQAAFERGDARPLMLRPLHLLALQPVLEGKLPLVLQADRASDIASALAMAQDEHIHLIISGGAEAWQLAPALAQAHVPVILKPTDAEPSSFDMLTARTDAAAILHAAGVPLIISAGDINQDIPRLRQEAGMAVAFGLPHEAAVTAVTLEPARAFGRDKELGTVAVGRRADIVLWSGDPFEVSSVAEKIWIHGVLQAASNRQRLLVERYLRDSD